MDSIINPRLLGHPINWLIVWTVLAFAGFAFMVLHKGLNEFSISGAIVRPTT